ncbi:MAG: NAD-dependent epimerase/dehydratase family protein [Chitinophagaceae bacterium]|nr:NAD-dependent epimerase/dehydratase family protein [Chitinophagaceae bacterium]
MIILITGAAGFLGSSIVECLRGFDKNLTLLGVDNLSRKGSELNLPVLAMNKCDFLLGDISDQNFIDSLPKVDWIIDCAANPSVLAGVSNNSTLSLLNDNLIGNLYLLEKCKRDFAGFVLISTSRVYSINELNKIPLLKGEQRFSIDTRDSSKFPTGLTSEGVTESFSTKSPVSLYGATKIASEVLALEYHYSYGFPVWINRCGVIAGKRQLGKIDQGIFSFWVYQYALNKPLSFIGYGGTGIQVRDVLHPKDVFEIIRMQMFDSNSRSNRVFNIGGGEQNSMSLYELDQFCNSLFRKTEPVRIVVDNRALDIPLYLTDYSLAKAEWGWKPQVSINQIMDEIAEFAKCNHDFLLRLQ